MYSNILRFFVSIFSTLLITFFSISIYAAPGDIDRSFGVNGFARASFGSLTDIYGSVFQPDGKYIVVGRSSQTASGEDFYVVRFNANGGFDTSFDGDGMAKIAVSVRNDVATNVAVQADGKIVVSGYTRDNNSWYDFAVVRLNADGSLDTTFDGDGIVITQTSPNNDWAYDVLVQADNKIVVAGQSVVNGDESRFTLVRYDANGSLDTSFDNDGIVTTKFSEGVSSARTVELQTDGKIIAAGTVGLGDFTYTIFGVARYNTNGSLDTSFGGDGTAVADVRLAAAQQNSVNAILIQVDGKIVAVGRTNSGLETYDDFAIARFNADGTLDKSFSTDGKLVIPLQGANDDTANAVIQQPDGKLLVGGTGNLSGTDFDYVLMRLNPNGTMDSRFGNNGIAATRAPGNSETLSSMKFLADGKIAVAGYTYFDVTIARYLLTGSRETDFDGDKRADISIFRPSVGEWWYLKSSNGGNYAAQFGNSSDKLVPGDFTGDGKTDIAIFRPSTGEWYILRSEDGSYYSFPFGTSGDIPAVGDFDADGYADQAIFRPSDSTWYIRRSSDGGFTIQQFGASGDVPAVADYDGDGKSDIAIWRASDGQWWIQKSSNSSVVAFQFGNSSDKPVQGDYTGDGKADVAIWRPSTGEWFILRSENQSYYSFPFGASGDIPAPGDYDGDGRFDATVFRPSGSTWYVQRTTAGTLIQNFGQSGDVPVPNAFVP